MISQFLIYLSFVLQATIAQQETTQAAEETTTAKNNTGLSDSHLFYTVYESKTMTHDLWLWHITFVNEILINYF